jgi:hypothetical protein
MYMYVCVRVRVCACNVGCSSCNARCLTSGSQACNCVRTVMHLRHAEFRRRIEITYLVKLFKQHSNGVTRYSVKYFHISR